MPSVPAHHIASRADRRIAPLDNRFHDPKTRDMPIPRFSRPNTRSANMLRSLVYPLLFMLVGLVILVYLGRDRTTIIDQPMGELDLRGLVGTDRALKSDEIKNRVLVLHFWGTWCPPCRLEYPEFAELYSQFEDDPDVLIASVSCSGGSIEEDLEKLQAETLGFHQQLGVELPVYADPVAYTRSWVAAILPGGLGYPTTLLIDRRGMIQDAVVGYRSGEMKRLAGRIETLKKS